MSKATRELSLAKARKQYQQSKITFTELSDIYYRLYIKQS